MFKYWFKNGIHLPIPICYKTNDDISFDFENTCYIKRNFEKKYEITK